VGERLPGVDERRAEPREPRPPFGHEPSPGLRVWLPCRCRRGRQRGSTGPRRAHR